MTEPRLLRILACASAAAFLAGACTSEEAQEESAPPQEYQDATMLWRKLLSKRKTPQRAVTEPQAKDVRALLEKCAKTPACDSFLKELDQAQAKADEAAKASAKRQSEFRHKEEASSANFQTAPDQPASTAPDAVSGGNAAGGDERDVQHEGLVPPPREGMVETEFRSLYGDCFQHFGELTVKDVGKGEAMVLKEDEACRKKYPGMGDKAVLLAGNVVESIRPKAELNPVSKITYQGREITPEQKACLEENFRLLQEGKEKKPCFPEEREQDPYGAPMPTEAAKGSVIEAL